MELLIFFCGTTLGGVVGFFVACIVMVSSSKDTDNFEK